jgi:hypothetical protein
MSTYSCYNIKIEDQIQVKTGITTGYALTANADGTTTWMNVPSINNITTAGTLPVFSNVPDDTGFVPYGWLNIEINGNHYLIPMWN